MRVFYHCYGGTHTSVVAACLHTGLLDPGRAPSVTEVVGLPHFDRTAPADLGRPLFIGRGPEGEEVYAVGFGPSKDIVRRAVCSFLDLRGVSPREYHFADALRQAGWVVKAGGILSRRLGLVAVGRPLAAVGIRRAYPRLVALVNQTRVEVRRRQEGSSLTAFRPGR